MQLKQQNSYSVGENVLPLVNVVFLLLIFFMLAGALSKPDLFNVNTPVAENDNVADLKNLTVLINAEGTMAYNEQIIDMPELKRVISKQVELDSLKVITLKADAEMNAVIVMDVMESLQDTGLEAIHLLTVTSGHK